MSPFDFTVYNAMQLLSGVEATDLLRASLAQNLSQVRFISVYSVGQYHNQLQFHAYLIKVFDATCTITMYVYMITE